MFDAAYSQASQLCIFPPQLLIVGYGDLVPVTEGGKLFATIYILVAGSILLNQMSHIAAIPLELRKRRIERAVLSQVNDIMFCVAENEGVTSL